MTDTVNVPREVGMEDAPDWYCHDSASGWANGWNSCRDSMLAAAPKADTDCVSLLADLDAGKPVGKEAAATIRRLIAERDAQSAHELLEALEPDFLRACAAAVADEYPATSQSLHYYALKQSDLINKHKGPQS